MIDGINIDELRQNATKLNQPLIKLLAKTPITPNQLTLLSFLSALTAAALLITQTNPVYPVIALLVILMGYLDLLDGDLARHTDMETDKGDLMDHTADRYADLLLVLAIVIHKEIWVIGFLGLTGVALTSYLGTQAQAVGVGRVYRGLLARGVIIALIVIGCLLEATNASLLGLTGLGWFVVLSAVLGHITALERFSVTWKRLGRDT